MSEWISVNNELPEKYGDYLVIIRDDNYEFTEVVSYDHDRGEWDTVFTDRVTHWMPIPETPAQNAEEMKARTIDWESVEHEYENKWEKLKTIFISYNELRGSNNILRRLLKEKNSIDWVALGAEHRRQERELKYFEENGIENDEYYRTLSEHKTLSEFLDGKYDINKED